MLALLVDEMVLHGGATAAAVVELGEDGKLRLAVSRGLPRELEGWPGNVDSVGANLRDALCAGVGGRFRRAFTFPLSSGGHPFGALVLLHAHSDDLDPRWEAVVVSLVELCSTALGSARLGTELRRAQADLRASRAALVKSERLRALGQMAAGVSHDLRNLLNPLSLHLQLVKRSLAKGDTNVLGSLKDMDQIIKRGIETVERIRDFCRETPEGRVDDVDVNHLVREATRLVGPLAPTSGKFVRFREELGKPPIVRLNKPDLFSALNNLLVNAMDALAEAGGTITLATSEREGRAIIRISDDGPGIPPEIERRVFEPFFTTKGADGTGLGLAMVHAFVRRHGGTLSLDTAPGRGAAFTLSFPAAS